MSIPYPSPPPYQRRPCCSDNGPSLSDEIGDGITIFSSGGRFPPTFKGARFLDVTFPANFDTRCSVILLGTPLQHPLANSHLSSEPMRACAPPLRDVEKGWDNASMSSSVIRAIGERSKCYQRHASGVRGRRKDRQHYASVLHLLSPYSKRAAAGKANPGRRRDGRRRCAQLVLWRLN